MTEENPSKKSGWYQVGIRSRCPYDETRLKKITSRHYEKMYILFLLCPECLKKWKVISRFSEEEGKIIREVIQING